MEDACEHSRRNSHEYDDSPTEPQNTDDVCVNTQQQCETPEKCPALSSFAYKIIICALCLLLLGALMSLCAVCILYHNKVAFTKDLREKHDDTTARQVVLDSKVKETERLYKELKVKHHELSSACNDTKHLYEMLKVKFQQGDERLSVCNEGWSSFGLKCYYFSTEKLNWTQSRDYCMEKGGHLVIIISKTEQDFLSSQIEETHWIGLNDLETEGKWMWVNNQSLKETGVTFWYSAPRGPNQPDNWRQQDPSGENCAALGDENGNTHKWFDASCRKIKKYICEK